jgi:hypothetical protein
MGLWKNFESTVVRLKELWKNINKTDKYNHTQEKRYLEVISRSTRFKEFNREKKQQQKH